MRTSLLMPLCCLAFGALLTSGAPRAAAQIVFESATGPSISMGIVMGTDNWLFHNFQIQEPIEFPVVGMFVETYQRSDLFAAVVALTGPNDEPDSIDLSTPDLVGTAVIKVPITGSAGGEVSTLLPATLNPGWYALGFGTGAFGAAPGPVSTLALTTDLVPTAKPYSQYQTGHPFHANERFYHSQAIRFFVAIPEPSADFNRSGFIDDEDLVVWRSGFGASDDADADGDDDSDGADFLQWQRNLSPAPLIANGDFESGVLEPWTAVVTPSGDAWPSRVEMFDVDGDGTSSYAMRTRVGMLEPDGVNTAGGGIQQTFDIETTGHYMLSLDLAAINNDTSGNTAPGDFDLLVDNVLVDSVDLNGTAISPGQVLRDSMAIALDLTAGMHTLQVLVKRPALNSRDIYQYVDDIVLTRIAAPPAYAVPEPSAMALWSLAISGPVGRRRIQAISRVTAWL